MPSISDRIKLVVQIIEVVKEVIRLVTIIILSLAGLTVALAILSFVKNNIITGIVLCQFAAFGIYLAIRIDLFKKVEAGVEAKTCLSPVQVSLVHIISNTQ